MSDRPYPPEFTHELWASALSFMMTNAADAWASMLGQGVRFLMPPKVEALPRAEDRAAALADAERERLATGDLFYLDAAACDVAAAVELRHQSVEHLVPSAAGFLVWEKPPMYLRGGVPIRAASWGVAYDGGTWASWWSDTFAGVQLGQVSAAVLTVNGSLTYHEETHIRSRSWPAQLGDPGDPAYGMFRGLIGAWAAIDTGAVEEEQVPPLPRVRKVARRQLQTEAPPVRSFTPSATGGTTTSPQTIVRRTLAGLLLEQPYPGELPAELAPWHCYVKDSGHCLLAVLDFVGDGYKPTAGGPARVEEACVPVPVKAVLRAGWRIGEGGYVHAAVRYDPELGVVTDPEDDEF